LETIQISEKHHFRSLFFKYVLMYHLFFNHRSVSELFSAHFSQSEALWTNKERQNATFLSRTWLLLIWRTLPSDTQFTPWTHMYYTASSIHPPGYLNFFLHLVF
jgi:hypothetical protein